MEDERVFADDLLELSKTRGTSLLQYEAEIVTGCSLADDTDRRQW